MAGYEYQKCPACGKKKNKSKTVFYLTPQGEICNDCYYEIDFGNFIDYIGNELQKDNLDRVVKVVTSDIGVLSNTKTRAYQTGLMFVIKSTVFSASDEIKARSLEVYLNDLGNYHTAAEDVINALLEANFLKATDKPGTYLPGDNAIHFAEKIKYRTIPEKEATKNAYGLLNYILMCNPERRQHSMNLKVILATAQDVLNNQKKKGGLTFDVHISDFLKHANDISMNTVSMTNNLDKWLGLTPDGDPENPAFFDGMDPTMGYTWTEETQSWDITLNMKKEWVELRERLNSRMRAY